MTNNKNSAVSDEPVQVLFVLQDKFDLLDFAGPFEVLSQARQNKDDDCKFAVRALHRFIMLLHPKTSKAHRH